MISELLSFAARHSPYYRDQPWAARLRAGATVRLHDIPITRKQAVKDRTEIFYCDMVPPREGRVIEKFTSGSTGVPLRVLKTLRHFAINARENQRLAAGWGLGEHRGVVHTSYAEGGHAAGSVTEEVMPNGSHHWNIYTFASAPIADLLCEKKATHFNSRPSVVLGALREDRDFSFLRLISTVSELIAPELRLAIAKLPECRFRDSYGAVETGLLASECAECGEYHAAAGHAVVEVLDEKGRPAERGAMGRVIVTPLFNLAMPLLRYDLGDYVVVSPGGRCSRPGPIFRKIVGRERNLFKLPQGGWVTPNIAPEDILALGIRQYKLIQTSLDKVELLYVPFSPGTVLAESEAQRLINNNLSSRMRAVPVRVDTMPLSKGGKFLMHECLI